MRRAASRAFPPAQASTAARASATSVSCSGCFGAGINVCRYIICICIHRRKAMLTTASRTYGVADPSEAPSDDRERVSPGDPRRPAASAANRQDAVVLADGDRRRPRRVRGRRGAASFEPVGDRARRLGADLHRQRGRLRRPHAFFFYQSRPRPISPDRFRRTRAAFARKGTQLAVGGKSSPARRGSSTPRAACLRMGPRR